MRTPITFLVLAAFALAHESPAQPPKPSAKDAAGLELVDVPAGAAVLLDGKDVGGERRFGFDLRPGQARLLTLTVRFAPGREAEQRVLLKPGWQVRYTPRTGAEGRPELVLQSGHRTPERGFLSPDGRLLLTGGHHDPVALLWDARTGTVLRQFPGKKALTPAGFAGGGSLVVAHDRETVFVWEVQTGKLFRSFSRKGLGINSVAISRDGKLVLAGGYTAEKDGDVRGALWEIAGGRQVQTFRGTDFHGTSADLSPDGTLAAFGGQQAVVLLDTRTGKEVKRLEFTGGLPKSSLPGVAFSPDGKRVVAINGNNHLMVWEVASGAEQLRFTGHEKTSFHQHVSWSADGRTILSGGGWNEHGEISVWDAATGKKVRDLGIENVVVGDPFRGKARPTFRGHSWGVNHSSFSADSKVVVSSGGSTTVIWEIETGKRVRTFQGQVGQINSVAVSPDGRRALVTRSSGGGADTRQWHLGEGRPKESFPSPQWATSVVAYNPRQPGVLILGSEPTNFASGRMLLCDPNTAKVERNPSWGVGLQGDIYYVADFSPDGKTIATASAVSSSYVRDPARKGYGANQINVWDAQTGERLRTFEDSGSSIRTLVFSSDGRRLLTTEGWQAVVRDALTGAIVRRLEFPKESQRSGAFHPNGRTIAVGTDEGVVRLRDVPPGQAAGPRPFPDREMKAHEGAATWLAFTPDGTHLLSAGWDHTACLWEAATGRLVHRLRGHADAIFCAALAADGRHLLTGSRDGTARWWDLATGEELACLIQLAGGKDWVVTTPDGLFDGSARGREQVAYRVGGGLNVVPVDRFFQDFYRPGLLNALARGEPVKAEVQIGKQSPPNVRIVSPKEGGRVAANGVTLEVEVTDEGGGVQGPWLFHNGARAVAPGKSERRGQVVRRSFAVTLLPGDNRLEVKAASGDGSWESEPARLLLRYEEPPARHRLFVLAVGINRYAQQALDLRFAASDARAVADLFARRGKQLYADVPVTPLLDQQATKAAILQALDGIAKEARPPDTLLVFLAGHGTMVGQRYFFVPHEFRRSEGKSQEEDVRAQGLAIDVLGEAVSAVPALKRLLIFDTCQSGGAIAPKRTGRDPFAFRGEIERLGRSQGVFTLAAAAAGEEAQEVSELGHGVLTYALLAGLRGVKQGPLEAQWVRPSSSDKVADVLEWFSFASGHVPRLTQKYFGREQDVQMSSQGSSFPLLPVEDR